MGLGGGTVMVALMTMLGGMSQWQAQCTSLLAYLPAASAAIVSHAHNGRIEKKLAKRLLIWGIGGMAAGIALAFWLPQIYLKKAFAVFLIALGLWQWHEGEKAHKDRNGGIK